MSLGPFKSSVPKSIGLDREGTYVMETQCCDNGVFERPMLRTPAGRRDGPNGKESLEGGNDYCMFG